MANFTVTYDLNGPHPSHHEMDQHMRQIGNRSARVLETVWWVDFSGTAAELRDRVQTILRHEDSLLVVECKSAAWHNLLVDHGSLIEAWKQAG